MAKNFSFGGFPTGGLMAEGYPGGPGAPTYGVNRKNPNMLSMLGFGNPSQGFQMPPGNLPPPMNFGGEKAFGEGAPPGTNPGAPPWAPPGGGMPPGVPPGGGMPPGAPPGGLPPPATTRPMRNQPYGPPGQMQPGQLTWGVGTNGYVPQMSPAAQQYIQQQMYGISSSGLPLGTGVSPWVSQVDPNDYLASIGQLSGNPFGG